MAEQQEDPRTSRASVGAGDGLVVIAWEDPVVEAVGYAPESAYVEYCWLPILGPSATFAYRRLGRLAIEAPRTRLGAGELFASLGLGRGSGPHGPGPRALERLGAFGVLARREEALAVRRALPPLTRRQLGRLPAGARAAHDHIYANRALARTA